MELNARGLGRVLAALVLGLLVMLPATAGRAQELWSELIECTELAPALERAVGSVEVQVQLAGRGGPPPPPGMPVPPARMMSPAPGVPVQVVAADALDTVIVEQIADAEGRARFDLPPGRYWLLVPWSSDLPGLPGVSPVGVYLPEGQPVAAREEVTVTPGATAAVALTIQINLP
jgi:hypothetical protein